MTHSYSKGDVLVVGTKDKFQGRSIVIETTPTSLRMGFYPEGRTAPTYISGLINAEELLIAVVNRENIDGWSVVATPPVATPPTKSWPADALIEFFDRCGTARDGASYDALNIELIAKYKIS
jgi:hypothetical protein